MRLGSRVECVQRSQALRRLLSRHPCRATAGYTEAKYENSEPLNWDFVEVLVIGAGGIGCEVLHCLAMSGFARLTILDMDHIELTNLNRQFLFTSADIGKAKSEVAAAAVMRRCPGVRVISVVGKAEAQSDTFYADFFFIILAVDSFETRRWVNRKVAELASWDIVPRRELDVKWGIQNTKDKTNNTTVQHTDSNNDGEYVYCMRAALPLFDTASGGFKAQCRLIDMAYNATACIECSAYLYEEQGTSRVPAMCTLANTPRSREHCVLYAQLKLFPESHPDEMFDSANEAHIRWITVQARARQVAYAITGPDITESYTLGIVKRIVPSVSYPNSLVAGQVVVELVKCITGVGPTLNNYFFVDCAATASGTNCARRQLRAPHSIGLTIGDMSNATGSSTSCCPICSPLYFLHVDLECTPRELAGRIVRLAHTATPEQEKDIFHSSDMDGTLSLLFTRICVERELVAAAEPQEVYLCFAAGHPCAHGITGTTIRDILLDAGHAQLLALWCDTARHDVRVFAEWASRTTSGEAYSMRVVVSPHMP